LEVQVSDSQKSIDRIKARKALMAQSESEAPGQASPPSAPRQLADRLIAEGNRAEDAGDIAGACRKYLDAIAIADDYAVAHLNLGIARFAAGDVAGALQSYERALTLEPRQPFVNYNLALVVQSQGDISRAEQLLLAAIAGKPDFFEARIVLAHVQESRGSLDEAAASLQSALALRPDHAGAHRNLGAVRQAQNRLDDAIASYRTALSIEPNSPDAHFHIGNMLNAQRRSDDAAASYRMAISLRPDFAEAQYNLGHLHYLDEALPYYRQAVEHNPDYAHARWGVALSQQGVLAAKPDSVNVALAAFGSALAELDDWFDHAHIDEGVEVVGSMQPFFVAYQDSNNRDVLARYGKLCARLMKHWQDAQGLAPGRLVPHETIRVGIVSAQVRDQSVWTAIVRGWFKHLDRERFSLHVFNLGTECDQETAFARSRATYFEQGPKNLREWAEAILGQNLDVLIYPEIGMDPTTVKLASMRLVAVQVATWGHPETTGLPTIDYYLSAAGMEPNNSQECYTEKLVALPHLGCCYERLAVQAAMPDLDALGIRADRPLLVCAGTPFKYTPRFDAVLVAIARSIGRCQFIFFHHGLDALAGKLRRRLETVFANAGLDVGNFVAFIPYQQRPAFYGLLQRADVYLDTIGFSGFNTAMQAVECGLPIVTSEGRFLRGRLASGILKRMELSELVVASDEDYVKLAVRLVFDIPYRKSVRERIVTSRHILFEDTAPIRELEEFLVWIRNRHPFGDRLT
jgi:protein O-GlcNAc transferase